MESQGEQKAAHTQSPDITELRRQLGRLAGRQLVQHRQVHPPLRMRCVSAASISIVRGDPPALSLPPLAPDSSGSASLPPPASSSARASADRREAGGQRSGRAPHDEWKRDPGAECVCDAAAKAAANSQARAPASGCLSWLIARWLAGRLTHPLRPPRLHPAPGWPAAQSAAPAHPPHQNTPPHPESKEAIKQAGVRKSGSKRQFAAACKHLAGSSCRRKDSSHHYPATSYCMMRAPLAAAMS